MGGLLISLATYGTLMDSNKLLKVDDLGVIANDNSRSKNQMEDLEAKNNSVENDPAALLFTQQDVRTQEGLNQPAVETVKMVSNISGRITNKTQKHETHRDKPYVERYSTLEEESSGVTYRASRPNLERMRSDGNSPMTEESKRSHYEGAGYKRTNQKIGGLSTRDVLKAFKMAIVP